MVEYYKKRIILGEYSIVGISGVVSVERFCNE